MYRPDVNSEVTGLSVQYTQSQKYNLYILSRIRKKHLRYSVRRTLCQLKAFLDDALTFNFCNLCIVQVVCPNAVCVERWVSYIPFVFALGSSVNFSCTGVSTMTTSGTIMSISLSYEDMLTLEGFWTFSISLAVARSPSQNSTLWRHSRGRRHGDDFPV